MRIIGACNISKFFGGKIKTFDMGHLYCKVKTTFQKIFNEQGNLIWYLKMLLKKLDKNVKFWFKENLLWSRHIE